MKIRVHKVSVNEDDRTGTVVYEIEEEDKRGIDEPFFHYAIQPFSKPPHSEKDLDGRSYIWTWESGDKDSLTLTPSFRCRWRDDLTIHLYFRNGKIDLINDSTPMEVIDNH